MHSATLYWLITAAFGKVAFICHRNQLYISFYVSTRSISDYCIYHHFDEREILTFSYCTIEAQGRTFIQNAVKLITIWTAVYMISCDLRQKTKSIQYWLSSKRPDSFRVNCSKLSIAHGMLNNVNTELRSQFCHIRFSNVHECRFGTVRMNQFSRFPKLYYMFSTAPLLVFRRNGYLYPRIL